MISEIIPVLVGGLLALAGALIGPFFQRKHEYWKAAREDSQLLREKAAELFSKLDRITAEANQASVSAIRNLMEKDAVPSPLPDLGKVRLLVAVYFPDATSIVETYEAKNLELTKTLVSEIDKAAKSHDAQALKAVNAFLVQQKGQTSCDFVRQIRDEISTKVPRLK